MKLLIRLSLCAFLVSLGSSACAEFSPDVEAEIRQSIEETEAEGGGSDDCGGYVSIQGEVTAPGPDGAPQNRPIPHERRNEWGCNSESETKGKGSRTDRIVRNFKVRQQEGAAEDTGKIILDVMVVANKDPQKSVTVDGKVTDQRDKPVKYATVTFTNRRSGKVDAKTKSDANGFYEAKVTSGDYLIEAEKKGDCQKASAARLICGYGPVTGPVLRQPNLRQDLRMNCAKLYLVMTGGSHVKAQRDEEGFTYDMGVRSAQDGWSTLEVDPATGKITGSGEYALRLEDGRGVGRSTDGLGGYEQTDYALSYDPASKGLMSTTGQLAGGTATLTVTLTTPQASLNASADSHGIGTGWSGGGFYHYGLDPTSQKNQVQAESQTGALEPFQIPFVLGATKHVVWAQDFGEGVTARMEYDFILKEEPPSLGGSAPPPQGPEGDSGEPGSEQDADPGSEGSDPGPMNGGGISRPGRVERRVARIEVIEIEEEEEPLPYEEPQETDDFDASFVPAELQDIISQFTDVSE